MSTKNGPTARDYRSKARINSELIAKNQRDDETDQDYARRLDVGVSQLRILRGDNKDKGSNPDVLLRTIRKIAPLLGLEADALVFREFGSSIAGQEPTQSLPMDASFYESMIFGYFITNAYGPRGDDAWFSEEIQLKREVANARRAPGCSMSFRGTSSNVLGASYDLYAELFPFNLFQVRGIGTNKRQCWNGVCHVIVNYKRREEDKAFQVLCGHWSGWRHIGDFAIYGFLISSHPLAKDDIRKIIKQYHIFVNLRDSQVSDSIPQTIHEPSSPES